MKYYEIATGYTPIPAKIGAATEIVAEELYKSFRDQKLDVVLVDIECKTREENDYKFLEVKVPSIFQGTDISLGIAHKLKRVVYSIKLAKTLKREIKGQRDEEIFLHFHNQYNMFFFLLFSNKKIRKKVNLIYTNHSYIWHGEWDKIKGSVRRKYFQEIYSMKNADKVYILNEKAYENIKKHVGKLKGHLSLVNNGVNTAIYRPLTKEEIFDVKREYSLEGKKIFIQVGSVCERKNQLDAIKLLKQIMEKDRNIVFCYAGGVISGDYKRQIDIFAKENGFADRIIYEGEIEPGATLNRFYNMAEAMVFPSKAEGFSLVILEAMAAGIPVLVDKKLDFELAGSCLRYGDIGEFINEVEHKVLNKDMRQEIVDNALGVIKKRYSWDAISREYLKLD